MVSSQKQFRLRQTGVSSRRHHQATSWLFVALLGERLRRLKQPDDAPVLR